LQTKLTSCINIELAVTYFQKILKTACYNDVNVVLAETKAVFTLRTTSYDIVRRRTMSSDVVRTAICAYTQCADQ